MCSTILNLRGNLVFKGHLAESLRVFIEFKGEKHKREKGKGKEKNKNPMREGTRKFQEGIQEFIKTRGKGGVLLKMGNNMLVC